MSVIVFSENLCFYRRIVWCLGFCQLICWKIKVLLLFIVMKNRTEIHCNILTISCLNKWIWVWRRNFIWNLNIITTQINIVMLLFIIIRFGCINLSVITRNIIITTLYQSQFLGLLLFSSLLIQKKVWHLNFFFFFKNT